MKTLLITLALFLIGIGGWAQSLAEEAAIKKVLEGHTQACMDKDAEKAVSYFAQSPYVAITYQEPGTGYIRGYEDVSKAYITVINGPDFQKDDRKLTTSDYLFRINGNTAWVTYIENRTPADGGNTARTHKGCYLEKEAREWKMLGNFWMDEMKLTEEAKK